MVMSRRMRGWGKNGTREKSSVIGWERSIHGALEPDRRGAGSSGQPGQPVRL